MEAALTKLQFLFGQGFSSEEVKSLMKVSMVGEFTPPTSLTRYLTKTTLAPSPQRHGENIQWPFQYHSSFKYFRPEDSITEKTSLRTSIDKTLTL